MKHNLDDLRAEKYDSSQETRSASPGYPKCGSSHSELEKEVVLKEHPIIFSGEMVIAILDGRKTQTRRVMTNQLPIGTSCHQVYYGELFYRIADQKRVNTLCKCPYGQIGDRLWVREKWMPSVRGASSAKGYIDGIEYFADFKFLPVENTLKQNYKWKPSIHMSRWASRITLEITDIRVERLQEITEEDVQAEGIGALYPACLTAHSAFEKLWDSINAKRGFGWEKNPWVWVLDFNRASR